MVLNKRWATFALLVLCVAVALATGKRSAMVVETRGENLLVDSSPGAQLRTLQVLSDGSSVKVAEGALLRLSFFKNGQKETITGPCTVTIGQTESRQVDGTGKIEVESARNASTELDDSTNLRRTGGAMQANSELVPENTLAFVYRGPNSPSATPIRHRNHNSTVANETVGPPNKAMSVEPDLEFVGLSHAYLTPEEANTFRWSAPAADRLEVYLVDGLTYADLVLDQSEKEIPAKNLVAGQTHWAILRGKNSATEQYFRIFSADEAQEYRALEADIRQRESSDHRSMYADLLYLNTQLGLLSRARSVALEALKEYPEDEGFQHLLKELNSKLRLPDRL